MTRIGRHGAGAIALLMPARSAAAIGAAIVLLLCGCVAGAPDSTPDPVPSAEPSAAPSTPDMPTAEPDPLMTVTAIVVRPETMELRDASGTVVEEFSYLDDPAQVIGAITVLLGGEPVAEDLPGHSHAPPSTAHRWDAFTLWEQRHEDGWAPVEHSIFSPRFRVELTGPIVSGVQLTTAQGVQAGQPWADLLAEPGLATDLPCSGPYLDFVEIHGVNPDGGAYTARIGVDFRPTADEATVARVGAPIAVSPGCA
jgi:hypothetical protein